MTEKQDFTIRALKTDADFHSCEEIQRQAWQCSDLEVVPLHLLRTVARSGGIVLGAFNGEQMVGFVFGFLGASEHYGPEAPAAVQLKHCSHMLGTLPEWQNRGVGYALKLAQRQAARAQALRLMTWTYDPLESRNANLNIARLGAVCNTYIRDLYGVMDDSLNRNLPTDRFQVEWYIASKRVSTHLRRGKTALSLEHLAGSQIINPAVIDGALLYPADRTLPPEGTLILVEIPFDFQIIKRTNLELALSWRLHTRQIFEAAFQAGYHVIDFIRDGARSFYVLAHTGDSNRPPRWSIFADDIVDTSRGS